MTLLFILSKLKCCWCCC